MLEVIITSSVLILIITALRYILKGKISLRLQYALWALAALRLLMPFSVMSSPVSVMNVVGEISTASRTLTDYAYAQPDTVQAAPEAQADGYAPAQGAAGNASGGADGSGPAGYNAALAAGSILRVAWYCGIAVCAACFLASNISFYMRLRRRAVSVEISDCPIPVYRVPGLSSPCLFGLLRPAIYLTPESFETEERLRHILTHELTHRRHLDHVWSFVRGLCLVVYWFDPLVWLAALLSKRDCELACDEAAIARLGEDSRAGYGRTLIGMMAARKTPADLLCGATTMTGGRRSIKERITLIAKKPRMLAGTLVAVLLIAALAVGCTFTGAETGEEEPYPNVTDEGQTEPSEAPDENENGRQPHSLVFEPEGVPDAVEEYAATYVLDIISYYADDCGYEVTESRITAMTQVSAGTAGLNSELQVWQLEYRIQVADPDSVMLAGGMQMEDGWITEWGSTGQPHLVVMHDPGDDAWVRLGITNTLTVAEEYGGDYSQAAMALYNAYIANDEGDFDPEYAITYEVYNSTGMMELSLNIPGLGEYKTYTVDSRWHSGRYGVLTGSYIWKMAEPDDVDEDIRESVPYYVTLASSDGEYTFVFFAGTDLALYSSGGAAQWYKLTYKYEGEGDLAADIRGEYDNLAIAAIPAFYSEVSLSPEETARAFAVGVYAQHLLGLPPGGIYSITDYAVVDWEVVEVSDDETAVLGRFTYTVVPENYNSPGLWAGNTKMGEGEYEGWLVMIKEFVLQKQDDGYWHCIDMGTGGASLPD